MLAIVVRFDLPDTAAAEEFDTLLAELLPGIAAEEAGTLEYTTYRVDDAPLARVFHERYADRAAHAAHEARPQTARFLARVRELTTAVRAESCTPAGGLDRG